MAQARVHSNVPLRAAYASPFPSRRRPPSPLSLMHARAVHLRHVAGAHYPTIFSRFFTRTLCCEVCVCVCVCVCAEQQRNNPHTNKQNPPQNGFTTQKIIESRQKKRCKTRRHAKIRVRARECACVCVWQETKYGKGETNAHVSINARSYSPQ